MARLIVCEKANRWAVALRWALADDGIRVHETRNWADCCQAMQPAERVLLALEMREDNVEEVLRRLFALRQSDADIGTVILTRRALREYEWPLRELGALHVALSPRNLQPLVGLAQRFLHQAEKSPQNPHDWAWERLPWPDTGETRLVRHDAAKGAST
jgi:hypothetical protein